MRLRKSKSKLSCNVQWAMRETGMMNFYSYFLFHWSLIMYNLQWAAYHVLTAPHFETTTARMNVLLLHDFAELLFLSTHESDFYR